MEEAVSAVIASGLPNGFYLHNCVATASKRHHQRGGLGLTGTYAAWTLSITELYLPAAGTPE
jgi:hypothetical protein